MNFSNFPLLLSDAAGAGEMPVSPLMGLSTFMMLPIMIAVFYFFLIRPQKKKAKQDKDMRDNLQIADEVVTIGGIIGRVLSVKDDTVLIETGGDKTRIRVLRSAIAENKTIHDS
jgi:preprotein translocase subunit YajC